MAAFLLTPGVPIRALDADGEPVSGAKLYVGEAGTSTPVTVYADVGLVSPHATPVVADSAGVFPAIYFDGPQQVKVRIDSAADAVLTTVDYLAGLATSPTGAAETSFAATGEIIADDVQEAIEDVYAAAAKTAGANVFIADQTITSTDAGATAGPLLKLYRDSASPAANDGLGALEFRGNTNLDEEVIYARLVPVIVDPTSGAEYAFLALQTMQNNVWATRYRVGAGLYADGLADQGAGTINVTAVYENDVLPLRAFAAVTFNGAGTPAIKHARGVQSITDNGTGDYTAVFTTAEADTEYFAVGMAGNLGANTDTSISIRERTVNGCRFFVHNSGAAAVDRDDVTVVFFR